MGLGSRDHLLGAWWRLLRCLLFYSGVPSIRGSPSQALPYAFLEETGPRHPTNHDLLRIRLHLRKYNRSRWHATCVANARQTPTYYIPLFFQFALVSVVFIWCTGVI